MIINTVTPHMANAAAIVLEAVKRCRDRSCTCNKKRTRQLVQEDYEEINLGSEFLLEFHYSALLTTIFMIFMYSSGLPLLYFIAFLSFFFTYWFDKLFLLSWHRKPPAYTLHLSSKTRAILKFCLIPHFFIGLYMYTNSTIITPEDLSSQLYSYIDIDNKYLNSTRFANLHSAIFLATFALFVVIVLLRCTVYSALKRVTACCRKIKDKYIGEDIYEDNFYSTLNAEQLIKEFNKTITEWRELQEYVRLSPKKKDTDISLYSDKLKHKLKVIEAAFSVLFAEYGISYTSKR